MSLLSSSGMYYIDYISPTGGSEDGDIIWYTTVLQILLL